MKRMRRFLAAFMAAVMICIGLITTSYASGEFSEGTYQMDAELSCYVNAMGGVEFGAPLLTSASLEVAADGAKTMTLHFTKSQVTIYSITCDTFIDAAPSYVTEADGIKSGTLGYYNADGVLVTDTVTYTLSEDTAENAQQEQVHYVDSLSFPIEFESDSYSLALFINSNVMGTQFAKDGYEATLRVDWSSIVADGAATAEKPDAADDSAAPVDAPDAPANVENQNGLNIYHVEDETEETEPAATTAAGGYFAYFRLPVLIVVAVLAVLMIAGGIVLIVLGRKERIHE